MDYTKLVKALRWCDASFLHECDNCLYVKYKHCKDDCMDRMLRDAAAAIEELSKTVKDLTTKVECSPMQISGKAFDRAIEAWNEKARKAVQE